MLIVGDAWEYWPRRGALEPEIPKESRWDSRIELRQRGITKSFPAIKTLFSEYRRLYAQIAASKHGCVQ
jgi:hypothetical protein